MGCECQVENLCLPNDTVKVLCVRSDGALLAIPGMLDPGNTLI